METQPNKQARIVLMGKTGQGKSTLGNQIMGVEKFKVGETMISETYHIKEVQFAWPEDKELQVLLVDTPGLADNRMIEELSNEVIIKNIEGYMGKLGKGLNVGLFCWEAKSRFSADDLLELALIQEMLGDGVLQHLWICITQLDKFKEDEAQKMRENVLKDLPKILEDHEFKLDKRHILFPQKSNFKKSIMEPLHEIVKTTAPYKPPVVEKPAAKYVQFMKKELEQEVKAMTKKLEEVQSQMQKNIIVRQLSQTEQNIERYMGVATYKKSHKIDDNIFECFSCGQTCREMTFGFNMCPKCYDAQKRVQITCLRSHPLMKIRALLKLSNSYKNNLYWCDSCKGKFDSTIFESAHCRACEYDLCPNCLTSAQSKYQLQRQEPVKMSGKPSSSSKPFRQITCENNHILKPFNTYASIICNTCRKAFACSEKIFTNRCISCDFDLCSSCYEAQKTIRTYCPKSHPLFLVPAIKTFANYSYNSYGCDSCSSSFDAALNPPAHCNSCSYDLCPKCLKIKSH